MKQKFRRLLSVGAVCAAATLIGDGQASAQQKKPNIVVFWGDDIGQANISAYTKGVMGYRTPNIDRIAKEGMIFTDYYAEPSCTAGRSAFITGQCTLRTPFQSGRSRCHSGFAGAGRDYGAASQGAGLRYGTVW